ncbi:DUF2948 family protein, partial [Vitreimonas sp.]|uniref:DUF2948 family protein n=1 Tax=Vitreimonas sp. TaxID=3069702 RepID=UPI002ED8B62C
GAAVQDALVRVGEISVDKKARRFTAMINRFRWESAGERGPYERVRAALSFDGVMGVKSKRVRQDISDALASVLSVTFEADSEPPSGTVRILLAGGGEIAVQVECLDAVLVDIGPVWPTPRRPDHERA